MTSIKLQYLSYTIIISTTTYYHSRDIHQKVQVQFGVVLQHGPGCGVIKEFPCIQP